MNNPTNQQLVEVCIEAAKAAGGHALDNLHRREEVLESFDHDVKLVMDRECQTIAEEVIHSYFPDHAILGEEGAIEKDHAFEWIVDPIDGTANYKRGFSHWACSVAVQCDGEILAGCIFVPPLNECYSATVDGSALCNGEPIRAAKTPVLKQSTFFAGLTKDIDPRAVALFSEIAPRVSKVRMLGSAAIDTCNVACGRSDGYYEPGLYVWDVAAGGLIARRAGAVISEWPRNEEYGVRFLCTAPAVHDEIKALVEKHFR